MQTYTTKASEIRRRWYLVDADDQVMGRLASEVAALLMGKWKTRTCPHLDVGDHVVVINADKVRLTGRKLQNKTFFHHTGWIGGARITTLRNRMQKEPAEVVRDAVKGMLPHNPLGRQMIRKLKVYAAPTHPHEAQQPIPLKLGLHGKGYPAQEETGAE
ncbi:MAG: 50S ribosomal protein L13 [Candidatus Eisenbacteria bacterium]